MHFPGLSCTLKFRIETFLYIYVCVCFGTNEADSVIILKFIAPVVKVQMDCEV